MWWAGTFIHIHTHTHTERERERKRERYTHTHTQQLTTNLAPDHSLLATRHSPLATRHSPLASLCFERCHHGYREQNRTEEQDRRTERQAGQDGTDQNIPLPQHNITYVPPHQVGSLRALPWVVAYLPTYLLTCLLAYLLTCLLAYLLACLLTYLLAYLLTPGRLASSSATATLAAGIRHQRSV